MKETILLTKHMRDNPEDSHLIESYEKNNGYTTAKNTLLNNTPENIKYTKSNVYLYNKKIIKYIYCFYLKTLWRHSNQVTYKL